MTDEDAAYYDAAYLEARGPKKDGGLAAALATPEGRAEFKALFESLDANSDGALSSKEWGQGIGKKGHEDDAFKEKMQKYFGGATIGAVASQFSKINADGDEKMTWEEWCTAVGADAELDAAAASRARWSPPSAARTPSSTRRPR